MIIDTEDVLGDQGAQILWLAASRLYISAQLAKFFFRKAKVRLETRADKLFKSKLFLTRLALDSLCIEHAAENRRHIRWLDCPGARLGQNRRVRLPAPVFPRSRLGCRLEIKRIRSRQLVRFSMADLIHHRIPITAKHRHVLGRDTPQLDQIDEKINGIQILIVLISNEKDFAELLLNGTRLPRLVDHAHIVDHADDKPLFCSKLAVFLPSKRSRLELRLDIGEIRLRQTVDVVVEVVLFNRIAKRSLATMRVFNGGQMARFAQRLPFQLFGICIYRFQGT